MKRSSIFKHSIWREPALFFIFVCSWTFFAVAQQTSENPNKRDLNEIKKIVATRKNIDAPQENGGSWLDNECRQGDVDVVKLLIQAGADVNFKDTIGRTPLFTAVERGHAEVAKLLIEAGADVNAKSNGGFTPLHTAVATGAVALTKLLLEHKADVNAASNQGETPVLYAAQLRKEEILRLLFAAGGTVDEPLCDAAARGNLEQVEKLIRERSRSGKKDSKNRGTSLPLEKRDSMNRGTPLQWAVFLGQKETAQILLEAGAKTDFGKNTPSPLHDAALFGDAEMIKVLLAAGIPVDILDKDRCTPLHIASALGHLEAMKVLLEAHASLEAKDRHGWTPFHFAVGKSSWTMRRFTDGKGQREAGKFLSAAGADKNVKDQFGATPYDRALTPELRDLCGIPNNKLFTACEQGDTPLVNDLIVSGADIHGKNMQGKTPLDLAASYRKVETVQALLKAGASTGDPFCDAAVKGDLAAVRTILRTKPDLSKTDPGNFGIPLKWAVLTGKIDTVELLLKSGSDVNARDSCGQTPLHLAASLANIDIAKLLIAYHADKNAKDRGNAIPYHLVGAAPQPKFDGNSFEASENHIAVLRELWALTDTPNRKLQEAAGQGDSRLIDESLARKAEVNEKGLQGDTPLVAAAIGARKEAMRKIVAAGGLTGDPFRDLIVKDDVEGLKKALPSRPVDKKDADREDDRRMGGSPLKWAVMLGRIKCMELLIDAGADVDAKDVNGYAPLYFATRFDELQAVKLLLKAKADVNARDRMGNTALHWAARENNLQAVQILIAAGADKTIENSHRETPDKMTDNAKIKSLLK